MKQKTAFVAYAFSAKNAGDLALILGALDILILNKYTAVVVSRYKKDHEEYIKTEKYLFERYNTDVRIIEAPFILDRDKGLLGKVYNHLHGAMVFSGLIHNKELESEIAKADIVVFGGGNLLRCSGMVDYLRLLALYYPMGIAKKMGKEYLIFPQSSGEIKGIGTSILFKFINNAKKVFVREGLSFKKLKETFKTNNLIETIDLAFFLKRDANDKPTPANDRKQIAFTFRAQTVGDIKEFSDQEKEYIYNKIKDIITELGNGYDYTFVNQTQKDKNFTEFLRQKVNKDLSLNIQLLEEYDPAKLINLYAPFDLLIGMRLHSIILAICGGTPGYGVFYKEWGLKNPGMMAKFDLPYTFLDDEVPTIDYDRIQNLLNNKEEFKVNANHIIKTELDKFQEALA